MTSYTLTDKNSDTNSTAKCTYWVRHDGREFVTDPNSEILNLARLTAYAEHGQAIHDAQAHHEIPPLKIDAPRFIDALSNEEHGQLNHDETEEVDGFPLVRADS